MRACVASKPPQLRAPADMLVLLGCALAHFAVHCTPRSAVSTIPALPSRSVLVWVSAVWYVHRSNCLTASGIPKDLAAGSFNRNFTQTPYGTLATDWYKLR